MENYLNNLPQNPGCYIMYNSSDEIIYVGKAKNIKKRVSQYFLKNLNIKTESLVKNIKKIDFIITNSDKEAYILENNLIKKHKPFYNIKLTDDKTYPYLIITEDENPRIITSRKIPTKYKKIYGPFPKSMLISSLATFLNDIFPFRKCKNIPKNKCIYYDMGKCLGPCIIKDKFNYDNYIKQIDNFLKYGSKDIINYLKEKRDYSSSILDFENAKKYNDIINDSKFLQSRQIIEDSKFKSSDYIGYYSSDDFISLFILNKRDGKIIGNYQKIIPFILDYKTFILDYLAIYYQNQIEGIVKYINLEELNTSFERPDFNNYKKAFKKDDKDLIALCNLNAKKKLENYLRLEKIKKEKDITFKESLTNFLGFYPSVMEAIDISQLFGTNQVGALIKIVDCKIEKKENRTYLITSKQDDIKAIKEVVKRRYEKYDSDLILIDGGKTHCENVIKELSNIKKDIKVLGLTKDNNHRLSKIYYNNKYHILDKKDPIFLFFYNLDEKIHNYAISIFRKKHLKNYKISYLDKISGIGEKRKNIILKNFKSYEEIIKSPIEKFIELGIPENIAKKIKEELFNEQNNI